MDKVILGKGCYLDGELGAQRPNNNQLIVGCPRLRKVVLGFSANCAEYERGQPYSFLLQIRRGS